MSFPPWEIASITVAGQDFKDWESVMVHREFAGALPHTAIFQATEISPAANDIRSLQIAPGDCCTIVLAGQTALTGYVNARSAAYDKERHCVQIQVRSRSQDPQFSSVLPEKHNDGRWENQSLLAIGNDVLGDYGMSLIAGPGA